MPRRPNLINRHSFDIGFLPASRVAVGTARWQGQGRASWEGSLLEPIISEVPHLDTALGSAVSRMFLRGHLHSHLSTPATPVTRQWQSASQGCAHLREPWGATGERRFALGAPRAFQRAWEMYFLAPRPLLLPLSPGSVKQPWLQWLKPAQKTSLTRAEGAESSGWAPGAPGSSYQAGLMVEDGCLQCQPGLILFVSCRPGCARGPRGAPAVGPAGPWSLCRAR